MELMYIVKNNKFPKISKFTKIDVVLYGIDVYGESRKINENCT